MTKRRRLPNRRQADIFELEHRGRQLVASVGWHKDGKPAEIFVYCMKTSSDVADDARDLAVVLSIAMQHDCPLDVMRDAVCRSPNGEPAGLAGVILDHICGVRG